MQAGQHGCQGRADDLSLAGPEPAAPWVCDAGAIARTALRTVAALGALAAPGASARSRRGRANAAAAPAAAAPASIQRRDRAQVRGGCAEGRRGHTQV